LIIGLVSGTVASAHKDPSLQGLTLLAVQELDLTLAPTGNHLIAADSVGAGQGDLVLISIGTPAMHTESTANRPIDAVAVAIIEDVNLE